jgi:hypothetical protein
MEIATREERQAAHDALREPYYQQLLTLTSRPGDFPLRRHDEH